MGNYTALEKEWHESNPHISFNMWLMDELIKARANMPTTGASTPFIKCDEDGCSEPATMHYCDNHFGEQCFGH